MLKFIEADNLRLHSNPGIQVFSHIWVNTYFILSSYRLNYNLFYAVEDNDVHTYHEPWHTEHSVVSPFIMPWTYFFPIVVKNYLYNYRLQGKCIVTFHLILRIILSNAWSYEGGGGLLELQRTPSLDEVSLSTYFVKRTDILIQKYTMHIIFSLSDAWIELFQATNLSCGHG